MTSAGVLEWAEIGLLIVGAIAWLVALRKGAVQKWMDAPSRLPTWPISGSDFMLFGLLVMVFLTLGPVVAVRVFDVEPSPHPSVHDTLVQGFSFQLAGLAACLLFRIHPAGNPPPSGAYDLPAMGFGARAFVLVMPLFAATMAASYYLLSAFGIEPQQQEMIDSFRNADSHLHIYLLVFLTVVIAPVTEELIFRAGVFRFLITRIPAPWAMVVSSVLFALMHQNGLAFVPLVLLGSALCFVFLKTGRLSSAILLHALFNLNSVLVTLFGADS